MQPIHLFDDYYYHEVSAEEFAPIYEKYRPRVFEGVPAMTIEDWMTGTEMQRRRDYDDAVTRLYELRIIITKSDEVIGWHVGRQGQRDSGHMSNTGILRQYQGRGIYSSLLPRLLEIYHAQGFAKVMSRHHVPNNAVLVPKLKAGFVITGFEIDERYGLFVILTYIFNEQRLHAYKFRTGFIRPDEEIKKYL